MKSTIVVRSVPHAMVNRIDEFGAPIQGRWIGYDAPDKRTEEPVEVPAHHDILRAIARGDLEVVS
jgi:hypothetical protein